MSQEDLLVQNIEQTLNQIKQVKAATQNYRTRAQNLSSQPVSRNGGALEQNLKKFIPPHLMPKNVGNIHKVAWPFWYSVEFNLNDDATFNASDDLTSALRLTSSFQVSQEAGFLITGISRHADDYSGGGDLGPLQIEIRDRQSSRFFNNRPIPIQNIGIEGYETEFPTPFLVMPNAFIDVELSTFLESGVTQNVAGDPTGLHQFTFHGFRLRIQDAQKVLSSIFG